MSTIIIMIFFLFFTIINADTNLPEKNPFCQCRSDDLDEIKVDYKSNEGATFEIKVKSWSDLQIDCKDMGGWNNFDFTSVQSGKILNTLEFIHCELPKTITLKNVMKKLGVDDTNALVFQSFKDLGETLQREHLQEFSNVTKLVLSHNGFTNITKYLLSNFSKLEYLDISKNNLTLPENIFEGTPNLKRLELHENKIKNLVPGLFFKLQFLQILNLMGNALKELNVKIFDELASLKYLNLQLNLLSELPQLIFHKLIRLETIDLSHNFFTNLPSKLFDQNRSLRQVLLYGNSVPALILPENFLSNLEKLEEVILSNNAFENLTESLFWGSSSLKYILLNDNILKTLPQNIFRGLQNVKLLSINNNVIETLPEGIFKDLGNLKKLDLSMNHIVSISRNMFEGLTSLTELNMERNHLKHIEHAALTTIRNLTIARFSHNKLQLNYTHADQSPFFYNFLLKELHLSYNNLQHFFSYLSINKLYLRLLDLSHNNISTISTSNFIFSSDKIKVDLRYNNISNILLNDIESMAIDQTEKRDVVILLQHNSLLCDCNLYYLLRYCNNGMPTTVYNYIDISVKNLKCVHTNGTEGPELNQLNYTTYECPEHKYFGITENCQFGCTCSIRPYDTTRILDCSNRNMSVFLIDIAKVNFVGKYPLILNLTGNVLTEIPSLEALKPINVIGLLLSNNNISQITVEKLPKSLTLLELHNNNIAKFDEPLVIYLVCRSFTHLTLSGNPITCDCDADYLFDYVKFMRSRFKDLDNLKCKDLDLPLYNITKEQFCPSITPPLELN